MTLELVTSRFARLLNDNKPSLWFNFVDRKNKFLESEKKIARGIVWNKRSIADERENKYFSSSSPNPSNWKVAI